MNEGKLAIGVGIAGCAALALLVYFTSPDQLEQPVAVPDKVAASQPRQAAPARPSGVVAPAASGACTTERLDSWRLISLEVGAYRQDGLAVLSSERRGTLTVTENHIFDGNLLLARVRGDAIELRCDQLIQTRLLEHGRNAADPTAQPEMRTALPDPSKG